MNTRRTLTLGALALFTAAGCSDLDIQNPNAPDAEQALATAGDVQSLIGGSYRNWWNASSGNNFADINWILSTISFQHSAYPANFGMVHYSALPRPAVSNDPAHGFYTEISNSFTRHFRAVAAVVDGLKAVDAGTVDLGADEARARAYGFYVLGLAHGSIALLYDQGYIYDPSVNEEDIALHPYTEVMEAALGYFDQAIQHAQGQTFTISSGWMSQDVPAQQLVRLAHSMKARYRAAVARTPEERAAVDWNAVLADIDQGVQQTWQMNLDFTNWWSEHVY